MCAVGMVSLQSLTPTNSSTFTANSGYGPSDTASYVDTNTATLTKCRTVAHSAAKIRQRQVQQPTTT